VKWAAPLFLPNITNSKALIPIGYSLLNLNNYNLLMVMGIGTFIATLEIGILHCIYLVSFFSKNLEKPTEKPR
jgi:hypothetical protein